MTDDKKIISFRKKKFDRRIADTVDRMQQCRALKDKLIQTTSTYIRDGGPSDEAILGTLARVFVQCGRAMDVSNEKLADILSEELV